MNSWKFLSHPWGPSCPAYAGGQRIEFVTDSSIAEGKSCNSIRIQASNHIGTHFDYPKHFCNEGQVSTDFEPSYFTHQNIALVWLDVLKGILITPDLIQSGLLPFHKDVSSKDVTIMLIRTGGATYRDSDEFWSHGTGLGEGLADYLRDEFPALRTVGIDSISATSLQHRPTGRVVHREFLCSERPLTIIEDMNLEPLAAATPMELIAAPLLLEKGDGGPCTVFAR